MLFVPLPMMLLLESWLKQCLSGFSTVKLLFAVNEYHEGELLKTI